MHHRCSGCGALGGESCRLECDQLEEDAPDRDGLTPLPSRVLSFAHEEPVPMRIEVPRVLYRRRKLGGVWPLAAQLTRC